MLRPRPDDLNPFPPQILHLNRFRDVKEAFACALNMKVRGLGLCARWPQKGPDQLSLRAAAKGPNAEQM